jgi:tetratricopeptide (TPR) repeat protein
LKFYKSRWKANTLKELNIFDDAILFYNSALEITPKNEQAKLLNQISACYKKEGIQLSQSKQYIKALQKFDLSIKMCTFNYSDKYSLFWWNANTLKQAGMLSEASMNYKLALEIAPDDKKEEIRNQLKKLLKIQ